MNPARRIAHSLVPALALVVVGTAGCGGGSGSNSQSAVLGQGFQSRADAVCRTVLGQKKAQGPFPFPNFNPTRPDRSKLPAISRLEAKTVTIYDGWLRRMRALGQPPTGQGKWAAVLRALQRNTGIISEQQAAGRRVDTQTFTRDYYEGNASQTKLVTASKAADLPACVKAAAA
jgi:hypothetical protein